MTVPFVPGETVTLPSGPYMSSNTGALFRGMLFIVLVWLLIGTHFQVDPYMSRNAGALFCGMLFIASVVATYWYYVSKIWFRWFFPTHRVFHLVYPGMKANVEDRRPIIWDTWSPDLERRDAYHAVTPDDLLLL